MKITVFLLLSLLVCSDSTAQTTPKTITEKQTEIQQPLPQDVHALLKELIASVAQQKVEITFLKIENQEQAAKLKTEINNLKQQLEVKQVVFSVSLLAEGSATLGPFNTFTTLIFKHVITNIGKAYDPNTGMFTAPVRGAYHFEFYIGTSGASTAAVLVKNTNHIFATYEHQSSGFGSTAQGASLLLEAGDVVFVRLWVHNTIFDNQNRHTTFSGHLLFTM
ncbi:complement C1q-like protein 2 [Lates japonicus]